MYYLKIPTIINGLRILKIPNIFTHQLFHCTLDTLIVQNNHFGVISIFNIGVFEVFRYLQRLG